MLWFAFAGQKIAYTNVNYAEDMRRCCSGHRITFHFDANLSIQYVVLYIRNILNGYIIN